MRLALVIGSLGGGGAERVMTLLANAWVRRGVAVTLITVDDAGADAYPVDPRVDRVGLGMQCDSTIWRQKLTNNWRRIRALRAALRGYRPDGIISFLPPNNVLSVIAARPLKIPVVVSERISPEDNRPPPAWRTLRWLIYRHARAITVQTERGAAWLARRYPWTPVRVIPNPVDVGDHSLDTVAMRVTNACLDRHVVLGIGRLCAQKGFDLLLQAFASVAADHPGWTLVVLGEGVERARLEARISDLGLCGRVSLPGFSRTPHGLLRCAQLFVLSSRYEGFPNALLEAMACGVACVSFDCPTGPAELIEQEVSGVLVPPQDCDALAAALRRLMDDPALRGRLGRAAQATAAAYSPAAIMGQWNALLEECGIRDGSSE
ncbi:MAG: glycosyltransferase family 4 protein [Gammaproteobacteria bacterium]